jgi:hypothetical protein
MRVLECVFNEDSDEGVYALSVVENPAMEDIWLTLSEQKKRIQLETIDEKKRLLLGAALIPDKKIYRNINGEEFYITFTAHTIEKLAHNFMKRGNQNNSTKNHEVKLNGMSVVEAWVVQDPEKDKSAAYGKTYEKGTWVCMMKVDDDKIWEDALNGTLKGFSIDALLSTREINFKNQLEMSTENKEKSFLEKLDEKFEAFFSKAKPVQLGTIKGKDGKTVFEFEGEKPEVGTALFILSDDKEKIKAPAGEHEMEDGSKLNVDENGLIATPEKPEEIKEPEMSEEMETQLSAYIDNKVSILMKAHEKQLDAKDDKIAELELKLKETPADSKVVKREEIKEYVKLSSEGKTKKERLLNTILAAQNMNN